MKIRPDPEISPDDPDRRLRSCGFRAVLLDEREGDVGDLAPSAVDRQCVSAVWDLDDLGHGLVARLALVGGVRDWPRGRVVLFAVDDAQRPPFRLPGRDLRLCP